MTMIFVINLNKKLASNLRLFSITKKLMECRAFVGSISFLNSIAGCNQVAMSSSFP